MLAFLPLAEKAGPVNVASRQRHEVSSHIRAPGKPHTDRRWHGSLGRSFLEAARLVITPPGYDSTAPKANKAAPPRLLAAPNPKLSHSPASPSSPLLSLHTGAGIPHVTSVTTTPLPSGAEDTIAVERSAGAQSSWRSAGHRHVPLFM